MVFRAGLMGRSCVRRDNLKVEADMQAGHLDKVSGIRKRAHGEDFRFKPKIFPGLDRDWRVSDAALQEKSARGRRTGCPASVCDIAI